ERNATVRNLTGLGVLLLFGSLVVGADSDWKEFSSKEGNYKIQFPGNPKARDQKTAVGTMKAQTYEEKNGAYIVGYFDIPGVGRENAAKIQQRLDGARDGSLRNIQATLTSEKKILLDKKHPGRDIIGD